MTETTKADPRPAERNTGQHWLTAVCLSPLLWGGLLTVGFYYSILPNLPVYRDLAFRYFCGHPLEYVTATLFFIAFAVLGIKGLGLMSEKAALTHDPLNDPELAAGQDPLQKLSRMETRLGEMPAGLRDTHLGRRIDDVCAYVRGRRSGEGLEEHLKYLAELAGERLHESYALVRTITWAVPIIGFLGTVIGITLAIANVTPEQLDTSLSQVTGGLAVAFDTTALALSLSLLLVFGSFLVQGAEQRILAQVEEYGIKRIACLFPRSGRQDSPLAQAEAQAAQQLLSRTESLITEQTELWRESLESLRSRWNNTLDEQQQELKQSLQEGMSASLTDHTELLGRMRSEFVDALQNASHQLAQNLEESRRAQQETQGTFKHELEQLWTQVREGLSALQSQQSSQFDNLARAIEDSLAEWQTQMQQSAEAGTAQLDELRKQGETLLQIVQQEKELTRLQERLAENLDTVQTAETFEQTLHNLTAAVNLLTARSKSKAA